MKFKNGCPLEIEEAVPGFRRVNHLLIKDACERFFAKRGMVTEYNFRNSRFLFGRMSQPRRAAA
jgi:hypothetical protein